MRRRGPAKAHGPPTRSTSRGSISSVSSRESEESQGLLATSRGHGGSRPGAGNTSGAYAPRRSVGHGSASDTSIPRAAKAEKRNRTEAALQVAEHFRDWLDTRGRSLSGMQLSLDNLLLGLQIVPDDDEVQEENDPALAQGSGGVKRKKATAAAPEPPAKRGGGGRPLSRESETPVCNDVFRKRTKQMTAAAGGQKVDFIAHIARYLMEHPHTAKRLLLNEALLAKLQPILKKKEMDLLRQVGGKRDWTLDQAAALKFRLATSWVQWQVLYNCFPGLPSVAKLQDHQA